MSKFSAEKPKGDAWGIEDVVAEMIQKILAGEKSPIVPFIGMLDIKAIKVDPETGDHEATVRIRRVESLTTLERIRKAQKLLLEQVAERRGEGTVLPFEEQDIMQRAFGGLPVGHQLQDDEEAKIADGLDEFGELRRHMVAMHDHDPKVITDEDTTPADLMRVHEEEHAKDPDDRAWPDHDPESMIWRRVDIAESMSDAEEPADPGEAPTDVTETDQVEGDPADDEQVPPPPAALFDDGTDEKT